MKTALKPVFLTMALLLHAGLIAFVYTGLAKQQDHPIPAILTVRLTASQDSLAENLSPPAPAKPPPPAASPLPERTATPAPPAKRKLSRPASRPSPSPEKTDILQPQPAPTAAELPTPSVTDMPALSTSTSASATPVKTDVNIPASYAAANRKPEYPALSRRYGEQGTVLLRVFVRQDGTAGEIQLKTSSGFPLLDKSAMNAVKDWRFNPATMDGKPVAEWYQVPIPFKLE